MRRHRTWISILLGLVLVLQGFAVSAATRAPMAKAAAMADAPCHGHSDAMKSRHNCCDESCPDMTSCALGAFASGDVVIVSIPPAASQRIAAVSASLLDRA